MNTVFLLWADSYHVADDSVWFVESYNIYSRLLRNTVNWPSSNWNPSIPSSFANVKLMWTLVAFSYHVLSFHLEKPESDMFSLKVVLWYKKILSQPGREKITFSLLIPTTAGEFCASGAVCVAVRHTSLFCLCLHLSPYPNKKCRACQRARSFVSTCAFHSTAALPSTLQKTTPSLQKTTILPHHFRISWCSRERIGIFLLNSAFCKVR